jgi:alkylation response protein AidB-like acyl-CoA dehydrogenase
MTDSLVDEREQFRDSVRRFLAERAPEAAVRRLMGTSPSYDAALWQQMARPLALPGLLIPESYGGAGLSYVELGIVLEELGRALTCVPFFATAVLAVETLLRSEDEATRQQYLPAIAAGACLATLALVEPGQSWDPDAVALPAAVDSAGQWRLSGTKLYVLDGHVADLLLVAARTGQGVAIFAVDSAASGLRRERVASLDETRSLARVDFDDVPAQLVGAEGAGAGVLRSVLDRAAIALAAEQVGGAQRCLEDSVAYAKLRIQFDRPIGSFQAIKHKCADVLIKVESARAISEYALQAVAGDSDEVAVLACLAKSYCSEAYFDAANKNVQIHGGIGFTWEHSAHLYLKRATASELLFGDAAYHRELLAQRLNI